jgi:hypothetical protein
LWVSNALAIIHFDPTSGAFQEFPTTGTPPGFSYAGNFIIPPPPGAFLNAYAGIDWGDGATSSPAVTVTRVTANGEWNVLANHSYRFPGTYSIQVTMVFNDVANGTVGIASLTTTFTAVIQAPPASSSPQLSVNHSPGPLALDIVEAFASIKSSVTDYRVSSQVSAAPIHPGAVVNATLTPAYQYSTPNLTTPIEGGMGSLQLAENPLQKKQAEFPLDEITPLDSSETLPISGALLPDRESAIQDPSSQTKHNSSGTLNFWSEANNPNVWDWTREPGMLFFEERGSGFEEGQTPGGDDARGEIASLAFLAAFSREVFTDRGRRKMKSPLS